MRVLLNVSPTNEQLKIVSQNRPGIELIRGSAGSGKTTTALLRLRSLIAMFGNRYRRMQLTDPVRVLVLTYNRTLRGYINELASVQTDEYNNVDLNIATFAKWAKDQLGVTNIINDSDRRDKLLFLASNINLPAEFILEEIEYIMGRFLPQNIDDYVTIRRDGRGISPRVDRSVREIFLNEVIKPYQKWINDKELWDWNDLAVSLAVRKLDKPYDIIIADETQDFSANQIRAMRNQVAETYSITFVVDTAQRIYARGFTWQEAGIHIRPENSYRLEINYRNTKQIAKFASAILTALPLDDDATIPDFSKCVRDGPSPIVLKGKYAAQIDYVIKHIKDAIDLKSESVAMLHPLGGGWFDYTKEQFAENGLDFVTITRKSDWPKGNENIALSTMHSAKGLEFDHVIILGLNAELLPHGGDEDDDRLIKLRRLLAMGISRAKTSVILGYKPTSASRLIDYLDPDTFTEINV